MLSSFDPRATRSLAMLINATIGDATLPLADCRALGPFLGSASRVVAPKERAPAGRNRDRGELLPKAQAPHGEARSLRHGV